MVKHNKVQYVFGSFDDQVNMEQAADTLDQAFKLASEEYGMEDIEKQYAYEVRKIPVEIEYVVTPIAKVTAK